MPLTTPLPQLKRELEDMLLDMQYLATALQRLRDLLPETSEKRVTVLTLLGRLNDANKKALRGVLDNSDLQIEYNSIRSDLSDLIQGLTEPDFDASAVAENARQNGPKQGNVLYRIPHTMPLLRETECVVRIALSEDAIVENITLDNQVVLKDLARISDLMQVELTDPAREQVFNIRSTSTAQQLITEEGYTQWFFYVEPLKPGTHPLEVKVCVLEMALNQIARKEIVFRETIQIFTEDEAPVAASGGGFKNAGAILNFQGDPTAPSRAAESIEQKGAYSPSDKAAEAETTYESVIKGHTALPNVVEKSEPVSQNKGLRTVALFLAFLVLGSSATWAFTPPETRDWWVASIQDTSEAYAGYIEKHPESSYSEKAYFLRASKTEQLADFRAYQKRFPDGQYRTQIAARVSNLESKSIEDIRKTPSRDNISRFAGDFPDSERLTELKAVAETRADNRAELMAAVEEAYVKATQLDPSARKVRAYLQDFPEHQRLDEVHVAVQAKPEVMAKVQSELEDAYLKKMQDAPTTKQAEEFIEKFPEPVKKEKFEEILDKKPQVKRETLIKMKKMEALREAREAKKQ